MSQTLRFLDSYPGEQAVTGCDKETRNGTTYFFKVVTQVFVVSCIKRRFAWELKKKKVCMRMNIFTATEGVYVIGFDSCFRNDWFDRTVFFGNKWF